MIKNGLAGREAGSVLIMALVALVVGALLLTPLLGLMGTGLMGGEVYEEKMYELYAADAGVEDAVWKLENPELSGLNPPGPGQCFDTNWRYPEEPDDPPFELTVNGKDVSVTIQYVGTQEAGLFRITSVATSPASQSSTTVVSYVAATWVDDNGENENGENGNNDNGDGENGNGGEGAPYQPGQGSVEEGTWIVEDGGTVDGNIEGTAIVYGKGDLTVTGNIEDDARLYVEGNLTASGNIENQARVYVKGDLVVAGNAAEDDVILCVGGNLGINKIEDGAEVYVIGNLTVTSKIEDGARVCVMGDVTVDSIEKSSKGTPIVCAGGVLTGENDNGDVYAVGHKPFSDCPLCCVDCDICCECPLDFFAPGGGGGEPGGPTEPIEQDRHWKGWTTTTYIIDPDSG